MAFSNDIIKYAIYFNRENCPITYGNSAVQRLNIETTIYDQLLSIINQNCLSLVINLTHHNYFNYILPHPTSNYRGSIIYNILYYLRPYIVRHWLNFINVFSYTTSVWRLQITVFVLNLKIYFKFYKLKNNHF